MTFTQLLYFQTSCALESITRAAEQLHISQPSVSAAIRQLEEEFGYPLLDRQGKRFSLTAEGHIFYQECARLLDHVSDFKQAMSQLTQNTCIISLGLPPMIGSLLLTRIFTGPTGSSANFHLAITEVGRQELLEQLNDRTLDMAFLPHDRPLDPLYRSIRLMELETVCCVSSEHPLAQRPVVTPRDLAGMSLVLFKDSFFQTEKILDAFRTAGVSANILLQTNQLSNVHSLVSRGLAAGFLFRPLCESIPGIVSIPMSPVMKTQVSLAWRSTYHLPNEHLRFIEHIRSLSEQSLINAGFM